MDAIPHTVRYSAETFCRQLDLPLQLVLALVRVCSGGDIYAWTPAPAFRATARLNASPEIAGQHCSWGPMLVFGADARALGFEGAFPRLCDSHIGIEYGCKRLAQLRDAWLGKPNGWSGVVAAYETGNAPRQAGGGGYVNQPFVTAVQLAGGFEGLANV